MNPDAVNLLIVDDTPANLTAMKALLETLGERVVLASSGESALRHLLDEDFAMILLDVQMPGMDGFEVARILRGRPRTREVPLIFLTATEPTARQLEEGYGLGAIDFLSKPLHPLAVRTKVAVLAALHRKAARAQGPA